MFHYYYYFLRGTSYGIQRAKRQHVHTTTATTTIITTSSLILRVVTSQNVWGEQDILLTGWSFLPTVFVKKLV